MDTKVRRSRSSCESRWKLCGRSWNSTWWTKSKGWWMSNLQELKKRSGIWSTKPTMASRRNSRSYSWSKLKLMIWRNNSTSFIKLTKPFRKKAKKNLKIFMLKWAILGWKNRKLTGSTIWTLKIHSKGSILVSVSTLVMKVTVLSLSTRSSSSSTPKRNNSTKLGYW